MQETAAAAVAATEASGRVSATELANEFPIHVVCEWIGNSPDVARRHYLQVAEEHFKKATSNPTSHMHAEGGKRQQMKKKQPYPPHLRRIRLFRYPHGESSGLRIPRGRPQKRIQSVQNPVQLMTNPIASTASSHP